MKKEDKEALITDLGAVKSELDKAALKEVQSAFIHAYDDTARALSDNYLSNVRAFVTKRRIVDAITDEEFDPDEKLMRSIEEQIHISDAGKKEFRNEILQRIGAMHLDGEKFDYKSHPRLKDAIENKLFADMKDMVKLTTSSKVKNPEQKERIKDVERTLIEDRGYCAHCAGELIEHVGTLLSRA